jgi:hypothetical protein
MARVEGSERKSFFALAASPDGVDKFRFIGEPLLLDDVRNTPADGLRSRASVEARIALIRKNARAPASFLRHPDIR